MAWETVQTTVSERKRTAIRGRSPAIADAKAKAAAGSKLFGRVLAGVADDMGGGRAEWMDPERLEVEHDAGEGPKLRAGLLDLVIGDLADTDTLGGAAGGIEGAIDLFLREPEIDEGAGERRTILYEAPVETEHPDVAGNG